MDRPLISHIGIAVADLEKSIALFELITGRAPSPVVEVPDQKVRLAMFGAEHSPANDARIELIAAAMPDSPIARAIEKKGPGLHHICIYVTDLEDHLARLKSAGIRLIDDTPRVGADGDKIAFVHPSSTLGVLIELQEKKNP